MTAGSQSTNRRGIPRAGFVLASVLAAVSALVLPGLASSLVTRAVADDGSASSVDLKTPIMVVLDTSGSMADSAGQKNLSKMQAARGAVVRLVGASSPDTTIGLLAYPGSGATNSHGCEEGTVQIGLGPPNAQETTDVLYGLQPDGDTPTSAALLKASEKLQEKMRQIKASNGIIVLVSDGLANCGPPVCKTAKKLHDQGIGLTVNTVGFDLDGDPAAKKDLECAAAATGGVYADASDTDALQAALDQAASSYLSLNVQVPTQMRTATGSGSDLGTQIPITVTNNGQQTAVDVRVSLDFGDSAGHGGALLIPRPIRFLGNLAPGANRAVSLEVRPGQEQAGRTFTWVVAASTSSGDGNTKTGKTTVVSSLSTLGPLLADVGDVAVLGDSYSSGEGAGPGNYQADTFHGGSWPPECTVANGQTISFDFPEECRLQPDHTNNMCHRSLKNYAGDLFDDRAKIIACSGATTAAIDQTPQHSGSQYVNLQASRLRDLIREDEQSGSPPPGAVLLTLGGNDIHFRSLIIKCVFLSDCGPGTIAWALGAANPQLSEIVHTLYPNAFVPKVVDDSIDNVAALKVSLWRVYTLIDRIINDPAEVKARGGAIAPIVVLPYVRIIPTTSTNGCLLGLSDAETALFNKIYGLLNGGIEAVVAAKRQDGRPFYYASDVENAFLPEHTVCAKNGQEWANTIKIQNGLYHGSDVLTDDTLNGIAHPNVAGYRAEAEALAGWSGSVPPFQAHPAAVAAGGTSAGQLAKVIEAPAPLPYAPAGGSVGASGSGFAPNSEVSGYIASDPRLQASGYADRNGNVHLRVTIPPGLNPGRHHVYLIGLDSKGHLVTVTKTVWVGGHLAWLAVLGLLVAIANLVWVGAERRRWRRVRQIASGAPGFV